MKLSIVTINYNDAIGLAKMLLSLAGFAMMEFLEMLRGVSKGLFGKFNN